MSAPAAQATPATDPGPHAADAAYYRQVLHVLIDMGTSLACRLHDQATAQAEPAPRPGAPPPAPDLANLAAAFDKVARTVRRCILLAQRLGQPAPDPARTRVAARKRILREVEDTIQRPSGDPRRDADDTLHAELRDRLDAPDLEDDLRDRPVPDIIRDICRDLGLAAHPGTRPFKRRTPQDLADLYARATAPSRPHAPNPASQTLPDTIPSSPDLQSTERPPAIHAQPGPIHTASDLPDDAAKAIAMILRHPRTSGRWHPPPGRP